MSRCITCTNHLSQPRLVVLDATANWNKLPYGSATLATDWTTECPCTDISQRFLHKATFKGDENPRHRQQHYRGSRAAWRPRSNAKPGSRSGSCGVTFGLVTDSGFGGFSVVQGFMCLRTFSYLWLVGNGGMIVIVVIIVPHSSIPY